MILSRTTSNLSLLHVLWMFPNNTLWLEKKTLVSGNAGDEKNLQGGGHNFFKIFKNLKFTLKKLL